MKTLSLSTAAAFAFILTLGSFALAVDAAPVAQAQQRDVPAATLPIPPSATSSGVGIDLADPMSSAAAAAALSAPPAALTSDEFMSAKNLVSDGTGQAVGVLLVLAALAGVLFLTLKRTDYRTDNPEFNKRDKGLSHPDTRILS